MQRSRDAQHLKNENGVPCDAVFAVLLYMAGLQHESTDKACQSAVISA